MSVSKIWPELAASFRREIAIGTTQSASLGRVAFCPDTRDEARRRRQARSAHAIEAERGARRPRWRPPEAARDLRPHGVLRRRLQRTLGFAEAVLLRRVSPSPLRPHAFDRAKPNRFRSQRNRLFSSPSASVDVGPRPLACHTPAPLPTCLSPPHPRSFSRRRPGRRFSCPGARCLRCLTGSIAPAHSSPSARRCSRPPVQPAGGPLRAAAVEVRRHRRWRQAAESSGVCMREAGATCEPGSGRPRWRPPEAARDLRPHGVLRRRLVAAEVCRLQALPRVTALLTAPLLAPQAGWPCQHAVLALPGPRRLDGSFAGRQESG